MAYDATILIMLLSGPSDIPEADLQQVERALNAWNFQVGRTQQPVPLAVLPIRWRTHAGAVSGERPQASLNQQLVDKADLAVALFWNRLGTPTGDAESGTEEEIDRLIAAGKQVGILRCTRPATLSGADAADQKGKLENWIEGRYKTALVMDYATDDELGNQVRSLLSVLVDRIRVAPPEENSAPASARNQSNDDQLWGRIETTIGPTGRREFYLCVDNHGAQPVREVRVQLVGQDGGPSTFALRTIPEPIEFDVIPPGGNRRAKLLRALQSDGDATCVITWKSDSGAQQENSFQISSI